MYIISASNLGKKDKMANSEAMAAEATARIHVGGLGQSVSSDDLRKVFSAAGEVEGLDIIRTKGRSFAYVDILPSSSNSLSKLFSTYNGCVWKGGKLKLEKAKDHYLTRLKREWAEQEQEEEEEAARRSPRPRPGPRPMPFSSSSSSDIPHNHSSSNKPHVSQLSHIRIFFPRLIKVKSLPLSGTGKHKYSFQRVETPALPIHFCDCEEHSADFNTVKQNEVKHHEEIDVVMNEEEVSMMSAVMNKLFERANISDTSRAVLAEERDNFNKPIDGSLSNEEEEDDDDLIINVVSKANNGAAMSASGEQKTISTKKKGLGETQIPDDGVIQSACKGQKNNTLPLKKKRKPLPNKEEDKNRVVSVLPGQSKNFEFYESGADLEKNEADENNLTVNVVSTANKRMALSGRKKLAKKFKSSGIQTCEDGSTQNEYKVQKNDLLLPSDNIKSFFAEERSGNEDVSAIRAEKGNSQTQSNRSIDVAQTTGPECGLKQLSTSCSWSQKSSWRELVGSGNSSAFILSNILQDVDTTNEKQQISDGPKEDNTLDSRNEKLAITKNSEGMLGKTESVDVLAKVHSNQPNTASSNSGRGSSWLHKSPWIQLVSDSSSSFRLSEILPDNNASTKQEHTKPIYGDAVYSAGGNPSNIMKLHESEPKVDGSTASGVRKEGDNVQSIPKSNQQTVGGNKDASIPAVENICNSEPNKSFGGETGVGETCSFMRSSASLKEWVKTKAALKGSRKKNRC